MSCFTIRPATPADAPAISALIRHLASAFTLHPDGAGAEVFLATVTPAAIAWYVTAPAFRYWVAEAADELAGVAAVRDGRHLYHLFVAPPYQGQGLARQLWQHARQVATGAGAAGAFTVNSTPAAVPVYARFGFVPTGPRVEAHGIAYVPMALGG